MTAVLVFVGAVIGAPLRYLTDRAVQRRHDSVFPWGTLMVNLAGSLLLGCLAGAGTALPEPAMALIGVGFCGALTTYSTFSYETLRLVEEHAYFYAVLNVVVSVIAAVGAAFLGFTAVHALVGFS
ncbi:fluoride efflux transporter CrcB [Saccharopolyspora sp. K220]|uniref:fluoride efflux transporter CrcB n=1 Tax=Saccharopolyspora soli TaxID=2926618 RepID=UPI001F5AE2CC|nr:fluoride efflux transporter CrcB [Saccharopolyspora soli]MCI2418764.1 fluoride efflux transporter CrcB [Saccharopolyspora soli]